MHYLNTSGASCESKIIGVYATRADGADAINKALGMKIHSKSMYKSISREAGNNIQYIWSYYSVAGLKKMMDAFDAWEGRAHQYNAAVKCRCQLLESASGADWMLDSGRTPSERQFASFASSL